MKDNNWIEWHGGECPVPAGTLVDVKLRNGAEFDNQFAQGNGGSSWAGSGYWRHYGALYDIVGWRLHQPEQPAWNGQGLPPVGTECEVHKHSRERSNNWVRVQIMYVSEFTVVMRELEVGATGEVIHHPRTLEFRPIRTEADRKREEFTDACIELDGSQGWSHSTDYFRGLYDAIAAGKIPGVKLL